MTPLEARDRGAPRRPAVRRFMLYSHDGFGLGHFKRNLVLARAITELDPRASVLMACGAEGLDNFPLPPGVDVLRLPGLRKVDNGRYVGRRLSLAPLELQALRASLLASAAFHFRPHVLLADKHPLGVNGELVPALGLQQHSGRAAALGLRDVLDDVRSTEREWRDGDLADGIARFYERVLVYGTKALLSPLAVNGVPPTVERLVRFCGYVVAEPQTEGPTIHFPGRDGRPLVIATAGGGEDGLPLLEAFVEATRRGNWFGVVVAGPQMAGEQWAELQAFAARAGVSAYRAVPQVERWYASADAVVAMGGYNTVLEAVASGTPLVCMPRTQPRQEQLIRARAFAARRLLWLVEPGPTSVERLRAAVGEAVGTDRHALRERAHSALELDGAQRAAEQLVELADNVIVWSAHASTQQPALRVSAGTGPGVSGVAR